MAFNNKKSYYNILEIPHNASPENIKKAYRRLALKYHPDKHNQVIREEYTKKFTQLTNAYTKLKNQRNKNSVRDSHKSKVYRKSTTRNPNSRKHNHIHIHHLRDDKNYDKQGIKINKNGSWIDANDIQSDAFRRFEDIHNLNKKIQATNVDGSKFEICRLGLKKGIYISINGGYYPIINFDNIKIYNNKCQWVSDKNYEKELGFDRITGIYLDFIYNDSIKDVLITPKHDYMGARLDYTIEINIIFNDIIDDPQYESVYVRIKKNDKFEIILISNDNRFISTYNEKFTDECKEELKKNNASNKSKSKKMKKQNEEKMTMNKDGKLILPRSALWN